MPQTIEAKIPIILHITPAIAISFPLLFADKATALKTTPTTPKTKLIHDAHENTIDTIHFHPYCSACIYVGKDLLGIFGDVHPSYASKMDVTNCVYAELLLDVILANKVSKVRFVPLDKYPSVSRDIALVVKEDVQVQKIVETIKRSGNQLVRNVEVFDIYQGEHVEKGYKSVALNIIYQANDHTLKDEEINNCHQNILDNLQNKLDANLRG